ncbi:MAG: hypothetical protein DRO12_04080 [Thermoprotei archaeon]|nr:MAG: hypothetical protein DRO12_04080 [Thermoprotei archaeon]
MAVSDLEEGYVRPLIREVINNYREVGRELQELSKSAGELLERINRLVQIIESSRHQLREIMPDITSKAGELKDKISATLDKINKIKTEDPDSTRDVIEDLKADIIEALKFIEELEKLLRRPIRLYIASKISEYVGLDQEEVLKVLEGFSEEEILDLKSKVERFVTVVVADRYSGLKDRVRAVFSSEALQVSLNKDTVKEITEYAYNTYELLANCKDECGLLGTDIAIMFLSRVNNHQALSRLRSYSREIVGQISSLTEGISKLSEVTGDRKEELLGKLSELTREDVFARLDDIVNRLRTVVNGINSFIRLWENQQKLSSLVEQVKEEYRRVELSLMSYYRKEYERYLNELSKLGELCSEEVSKGIGDILICTYRGSCSFRCPEDISSTLVDRLRSSIDRLLEVLHGNSVIVDKFCKGPSALELGKRLEKLRDNLEGISRDPSRVLEYHRYIVEANNIFGNVLTCIGHGRTTEGLEIDITELDSEMVKALIDVLKTFGKKLVLRAA